MKKIVDILFRQWYIKQAVAKRQKKNQKITKKVVDKTI